MNAVLRRFGFFGLDYLQGRPIARHMEHIMRLRTSVAATEVHQVGRLQHLIKHASGTTAYYRRFHGVSTLQELPVVKQAYFRKNVEEFTTLDPRLLRDATAAFTSGSHGIPLEYRFDKDKFARRTAEVLVHNGLAGYRVGMKLARLHGSSKLSKKGSGWPAWKQNVVDVYLPEFRTNVLDAAATRLARGDIDVIIGWPSSLLAVARHASLVGLRLASLRGIISYGEVLEEVAKNELTTAFGAKVLDRYALTELGIVAHEEGMGQQGLWCNQSSYVVELLRLQNDEPASSGEPARIVITDLYSQAMPLIRYDTGDIAVRHGQINGRAWLGGIDGRYNELIYTVDGEPLPLLRLYGGIPQQQKRQIKQFQIAQTGPRNYEVRVIPRGVVSHGAIIEEMRARVGGSAEVQVCLVEHIPPLPSGKQAVMRNEWTERRSEHNN